jgi:hypothetical protein
MDIFPKGASVSTITDTMQGNPNLMYSAFLMVECHEYLAMMRENSDKIRSVDAGTGALIAMYPDRETKKRLQKMYLDEKNNEGGAVNASILTVSEMMSCLSDVMEWTQKSYGGF